VASVAAVSRVVNRAASAAARAETSKRQTIVKGIQTQISKAQSKPPIRYAYPDLSLFFDSDQCSVLDSQTADRD
jgi:hypothetical protein